MLDFEVQRCTRRCFKTERELRPGETFYSVLLPEGPSVVRYDYSEEAWEGAPEKAIGWWKSQMPDSQNRKMHWAPNDVLLDYFEQLEHQADKQDVRYVLALLLLRRRVVRAAEAESEETDESVMVLRSTRTDSEYRVHTTSPSAERIEAIQQELAQLLFAGRKDA